MADILDKNKKFNNNKSKLGFNCLGPCYEPKTYVTHPITLNYDFDNEYPFCHVNEYIHVDPTTGDKEIKYHDRCYNPSKDATTKGNEMAAMNMLLPFIEFKCDQFLKIYNNIFSFEDAVLWIEKKKYSPLNTRARVFECSLSAYGKNLDMIDQQLLGFLVEYFSTKWIDDIYNKIKKYISIKDNNIKLSLPSKDDDDPAYINTKKTFINNKFINSDEIHKFMIKYIKHRKGEWDSIENHIAKIKEDFIYYVENKIKATLNVN